jgi:hypothetical protein
LFGFATLLGELCGHLGQLVNFNEIKKEMVMEIAALWYMLSKYIMAIGYLVDRSIISMRLKCDEGEDVFLS